MTAFCAYFGFVAPSSSSFSKIVFCVAVILGWLLTTRHDRYCPTRLTPLYHREPQVRKSGAIDGVVRSEDEDEDEDEDACGKLCGGFLEHP